MQCHHSLAQLELEGLWEDSEATMTDASRSPRCYYVCRTQRHLNPKSLCTHAACILSVLCKGMRCYQFCQGSQGSLHVPGLCILSVLCKGMRCYQFCQGSQGSLHVPGLCKHVLSKSTLCACRFHSLSQLQQQRQLACPSCQPDLQQQQQLLTQLPGGLLQLPLLPPTPAHPPTGLQSITGLPSSRRQGRLLRQQGWQWLMLESLRHLDRL